MKLYSYKRNRTTWLIPIIFVLSGLNSGLLFAQENSVNDIFNYEVRIGANIDLYRGLLSNRDFVKNQFKGQTGIKVFVSGMLNVNSPNWILAYGPTISIYNKSLGNSQDPLENDIQIDFLNSFTADYYVSPSFDASNFLQFYSSQLHPLDLVLQLFFRTRFCLFTEKQGKILFLFFFVLNLNDNQFTT